MRYFWSRLLIMLLAAECAAFVLYYHFGPRGTQVLHELERIKIATEQHIQQLTEENEQLQENIDAWKHDSFLIEKFAREKLAMQKEGEIIYFKPAQKSAQKN